MWLKELSLTNFRNYTSQTVTFSPKLNIFLGKNAQGKTNFLEAIYFLALTRSHRTRSDKDLIYFNQEQLKLTGHLQRVVGPVNLDISLSSKGRLISVNHLKQGRLSDYIGTMTVVLFAPEDLQLIKGAPSLRRKFIDIDLGQIKPIYLADLSHYNHILKQRNSYLKTVKKLDTDFLAVLDEQLAHYGSRVIQHRLQFVQDLEKAANKHHQIISDGLEKLAITYQSTVTFDTVNDLERSFIQQLANQRQRDLFKKNTGIGPHRDDLNFAINQMEANFGSQGQHRSLILSLKMAEIDLIKQVTGDYPILLLDDVMSELDNHRQTKLLAGIDPEVQTFITTTSLDHLSHLPSDLDIFYIDKGKISKKS
ncbi:DNA replication/repair protein RecF [Streptococcus cuniculipharyngis]|uniref:DNA replication and repair protein RecF n=1 Tax=Streptococcus cuniculipharyngis TaxID=1562651 RepID=A0A5C5SAG7_9STRE|nr:DNA replication/repair protein RecF [Streptococcus cuniculipharyngis]TWS97688.1 DNA replication/repair protein RecF [Streptococcus cuniculipharyngis]